MMNIKTLLSSLAVTLFAVSAATAADIISVEPEPEEYVRVCDTYGAGFFYIPGTEACLSINGYIRLTLNHATKTTGGIEDGNHSDWVHRGRLNIYVFSETDWGTLRSELRLQSNGSAASDPVNGLDRALISVAGFRAGYGTTYWESAHGGGVDTPAVQDGMYNIDQSIFFDYSTSVSDVIFTFGFQDTTGLVADMEAPDYYVGAKYGGDWGWVAATYIYDQNAISAGAVPADGAGAWKVSFRFEDMWDSKFNIGAWYMADGEAATSYVTGDYGADGTLVDYQWGLAMEAAFTDKLTGYLLYSAAEGTKTSTTYLNTKHLAVGLVWKAIDGLNIQTEYFTNESDYVLASGDTDTNGIILRVLRYW